MRGEREGEAPAHYALRSAGLSLLMPSGPSQGRTKTPSLFGRASLQSLKGCFAVVAAMSGRALVQRALLASMARTTPAIAITAPSTPVQALLMQIS